jgi:hypothetical protein
LAEFVDDKAVLVVDSLSRIVEEYARNMTHWRPGAGNEFLKWVLTNLGNNDRVEQVDITPLGESATNVPEDYEEFPRSRALCKFDRSDRKFVATALAHPSRPPILVAADTDWWEYEPALKEDHVEIHFLCPELIARFAANPTRKRKRMQKHE